MRMILILPTGQRCWIFWFIQLKKIYYIEDGRQCLTHKFHISSKYQLDHVPGSRMPLVPGLWSNPRSRCEQKKGNTCWWGWHCWVVTNLSACAAWFCPTVDHVPQRGHMSPVDHVQGTPCSWHGDSSVQPLPLGSLCTPVWIWHEKIFSPLCQYFEGLWTDEQELWWRVLCRFRCLLPETGL